VKNNCEALIDLVHSKLSFLLKEEGFQIIEQRSDRSDYCLVFLESDIFRIKCYLGPDYVDLQFGTLAAPLSWEDKTDGITQWYSLGILDTYFRSDTNVQILTEEEWRRHTIDIQFQNIVKLINQHYPMIKEMFGKDDSIQNKEELDNHIRIRQEEARQQFEILERKS